MNRPNPQASLNAQLWAAIEAPTKRVAELEAALAKLDADLRG
jgi:hypothetical protein